MRFLSGHALRVQMTAAFIISLYGAVAIATENPLAIATLMSNRGIVIVNVSYYDERDRQDSLTISCSDSRVHSVSQKTVRSRYLSFEVPLPARCRDPLVHLVDTTLSGQITINNEFRLIPDLQPAVVAQGSAPTWFGPVLATSVASFATLAATFLGARLSQFREERKAKFDLGRTLLEKEVAACAALLLVCRQMPSVSELDSALAASQQDLAPDSPVFTAAYKLREAARECENHLTAEILRDFELAVLERRKSLLELKY